MSEWREHVEMSMNDDGGGGINGLRERRETVEGTQSGQEETGSKKMK